MSVSVRDYCATCGGCQGLGSHKAWCPAVHGDTAFRLGMLARGAGDLADAVGPNHHDAANHLYAAAAMLKARAETASLLNARAEMASDRPAGGNR